ncbi:hypothetical protein [Clostridium sp. YIM B02500]|uniref:hypothetical protein n=1 Tax=Clostridium sp. YIM B02500 TaxID=2910681 RepID=UPI001EED54D4|nr:hypothetical protein [Clostridium sp. YIM B02500]
MKKFKCGEREFEMDYPNDVAPVLIAKETSDKEIKLKELEEKFKGDKVFSYDTNIYNKETGELKPITYYYIGAKCTTAKEYKLIQEYNHDFPPQNMLIEVILQIDNFKAKFYKAIKNSNCSMMDLIDTAIDEVKEELFKSDNGDYTILYLYDDGGWQIDTEISENDIEDLITSVRLVEKA